MSATSEKSGRRSFGDGFMVRMSVSLPQATAQRELTKLVTRNVLTNDNPSALKWFLAIAKP